jgi:hypothetical protein
MKYQLGLPTNLVRLDFLIIALYARTGIFESTYTKAIPGPNYLAYYLQHLTTYRSAPITGKYTISERRYT